MSSRTLNKTVIAICIQEPSEDGSTMDFGVVIQGDEIKFLHQAFITDSITHALQTPDADVRLYYINESERARLVEIVTDYLDKKLTGDLAKRFNISFSSHELEKERWGIRAENVFKDCFAAGYEEVVLIGSRTPTVSSKQLATAARMLKDSDATFGPTIDGRYYLIGMSGSSKIELSQFDWKSPTIYSEVAATLESKDLKWAELEIWYAIENSDDLEILARDINQYRFEGDEITSRETEVVLERILAKLDS